MQIKDGLTTKDEEIRSFLMIGQSNMAGRGEFSDVPVIKNPSCYMLRMGRWQTMREPLNPDRQIFEGNFHSGVSLGSSFADEVSRALDAKVGMIPCADGGTVIAQWMPGEVLFDHAVMMTRLAMRSSTFSGILWHQGESDCKNDEMLLAHKGKFVTMITEMRKELGSEELPLLIGELSENITEKWGRGDRPLRMNEQYHEIARMLPNCAVVSAKGLPMKPDGIHFTAEGQYEFGRRYAEAYVSLTRGR